MNLKRRIIKLFHPLTTVTLEPTNDCNMDCSYCFRKMRDIGYMEYNLFLRLVEEMRPSTHVSLSFGGESVLHPRFVDMARIACKKFKSVVVYSNGLEKYPDWLNVVVLPKPPPVIYTYDQKFEAGCAPVGWKPKFNYCLSPFYSLVVLWNGDVTLCCHDLGGIRVFDSVLNKSLDEVWNGEALKVLRRKAFCEGCELYKYHGK